MNERLILELSDAESVDRGPRLVGLCHRAADALRIANARLAEMTEKKDAWVAWWVKQVQPGGEIGPDGQVPDHCYRAGFADQHKDRQNAL